MKDNFGSIEDSYTTCFNVRHKRAGHLSQGKGTGGRVQEIGRNPEIVKSVDLTPQTMVLVITYHQIT